MGIGLKRDQKGFGHAVIFIVVIVLAVGGAGYYVWHKNHSSVVNKNLTPAEAAANKAVNDACNTALHDKDFCTFASNWSNATKFRSTITAGGSTITSMVDGNNSSFSSSEGGKESLATISIGNDYYTKDESDGAWVKSTLTSNDTNTTNVKNDLKVSDFSAAELQKTQYKKIGREACGNLSCLKYQITDSTDPSTQSFIWFDTKDFLLRRLSSTSAGQTSDINLSYDNISVKAPTNLKAASTNTGIPSQAEIDAAMKAAESASANSDSNN